MNYVSGFFLLAWSLGGVMIASDEQKSDGMVVSDGAVYVYDHPFKLTDIVFREGNSVYLYSVKDLVAYWKPYFYKRNGIEISSSDDWYVCSLKKDDFSNSRRVKGVTSFGGFNYLLPKSFLTEEGGKFKEHISLKKIGPQEAMPTTSTEVTYPVKVHIFNQKQESTSNQSSGVKQPSSGASSVDQAQEVCEMAVQLIEGLEQVNEERENAMNNAEEALRVIENTEKLANEAISKIKNAYHWKFIKLCVLNVVLLIALYQWGVIAIPALSK